MRVTIEPGWRDGLTNVGSGNVWLTVSDRDIHPCNCSDADIALEDFEDLRRVVDAIGELIK